MNTTMVDLKDKTLPVPSQKEESFNQPPIRQRGKGVGRAIGTGGEAVVGLVNVANNESERDLHDLTIPVPVQVLSVVDLKLRPSSVLKVTGLESRPLAQRAVEAAMEAFCPGPGEVIIKHRSDILMEVGQSSSSADILAAVRAVAAASSVEPTVAEIAKVVAEVEKEAKRPCSGFGRPGLYVASRADGSLVKNLDWWPSFSVLTILPLVDKIALEEDKTIASFLSSPSSKRDSVYKSLVESIDKKDADLFAGACTRSAELFAEEIPHAGYKIVQEVLTRLLDMSIQPLGVMISHTGPVASMLFADSFEGRSASYFAARSLHTIISEPFKMSVSVTPKFTNS